MIKCAVHKHFSLWIKGQFGLQFKKVSSIFPEIQFFIDQEIKKENVFIRDWSFYLKDWVVFVSEKK